MKMDNNSSRGSNISLIESEHNVEKNLDNRIIPGSRIFDHSYNTRYSTKLKKLYVDLSNSIAIDSVNFEKPTADERQLVISKRQRVVRRSSSNSISRDSAEFDFRDCSVERYKLGRACMDNSRRICGPTRSSQNAWLKYIYALCGFVLVYFYIQVIHNGEKIMKIHKEFDSIKSDVGKADFASKLYRMETILNNMKREQGGKIVNILPGTENFDNAKTLFGITLCEGMHGPRAMLQADMSPGNCWAIQGSHGGVIVKLLGKVHINAVSLEHISQNISPTGEVSSAPREFSVWGMKSPSERGQPLGQFSYNIKESLVQTFAVRKSNSYEFVEFKVLSNQGNPDFTCIYRFRVHGKLERNNS